MMTSLYKNLICSSCGTSYEIDRIQTVCLNAQCTSSLFAQYDVSENVTTDILDTKQNSMWRYAAILPIVKKENVISLGEGLTPLVSIKNLKYNDGDNNVFWKDESGNPTGSFKARGISAALSKAKELNISEIAIPTAGNAGGALAAYCARARIKAHVFMPVDTPQAFKDECRLFGAHLTEIQGSISDCGALAAAESIKKGWFQLSTLKEPFRLEGKKTMGYEIAEQLNWDLPDVIFYPTGGGTGLIGIWKAFEEMEKMGWIKAKRPRMVAVQSVSCDGIVRAFQQNCADSKPIDNGITIANGLRVPKPYASKIILQILKQSHGAAIGINDDIIASALKEIAAKEGMLVAPEGAALWAAFKEMKRSGWVKSGEKILLLNTGSGYKYLENIQVPPYNNPFELI